MHKATKKKKTMPKSRLRELWAQRRERLARHAEEFKSKSAEEQIAYIPTNPTPSEFEVQSFLYERLRAMGYVIRGEVASRCGTCIFDLVIYLNDKPVLIIECKKRKRPGADRHKQKSQLERYGKFGIPVDVVCGIRQAKDYVATMGRAQATAAKSPWESTKLDPPTTVTVY